MPSRLFSLRLVASSLGAISVAWAIGFTGCSRPEPVATSPESARLAFAGRGAKSGFARGDRRGARRGRVQELQLLPSPAGLLETTNRHDEPDRPARNNGLCPPDMASIDDRYCIDRYEASLVEILPNGDERAWSPYDALDPARARNAPSFAR